VRPAPVHLPAGHCGGGPAQKFGLPLTEVDGVESWHAIANSAAAAKPGPKRRIVCVSMLRLLAGSSTRDSYGRRLARQVPVATLRQVVVELRDALQCRRHASRRTHQVWSLSRRAYTRTRAPHLQRRKWLRCDIVRSAAGSGVRSAPRWSLHRSFTYLLGYAHSGCLSRCRSRASRQLAPSGCGIATARDRKSTRLNSSHTVISYAVFCLKK